MPLNSLVNHPTGLIRLINIQRTFNKFVESYCRYVCFKAKPFWSPAETIAYQAHSYIHLSTTAIFSYAQGWNQRPALKYCQPVFDKVPGCDLIAIRRRRHSYYKNRRERGDRCEILQNLAKYAIRISRPWLIRAYKVFWQVVNLLLLASVNPMIYSQRHDSLLCSEAARMLYSLHPGMVAPASHPMHCAGLCSPL
jgi:hypothetical protein